MRIVRYYPRAASGDGGITQSVRRAAEAAVRAGADVTVAVDEMDVPEAPEAPFAWRGVEHRGRDSFRAPVGLGALLEGADVLVLHSAWTYHNVRAADAARRVAVPYVLEPRGAYLPAILQRRPLAKRAWWWLYERRTVGGALALHRFFEEDEEDLAAFGYRGPFVIAPNGVHVPATPRWDGGSGGYVLWIGRFDPDHKGLDALLHGLAALPPRERTPLRLHGPDWMGGKVHTVRLVDDLGLGDVVTIGPPVYGPEKWSLIARARAFTYPSRFEGFGNSAAEAVAMGVPTLVTRYPLARWLAARGAALSVDAQPAALAWGLTRIVADDAAALGATGRKVVASELSWNAVVRSWLRQVDELLALRGVSFSGGSPTVPRRRS